jgi:hypothetical protein
MASSRGAQDVHVQSTMEWTVSAIDPDEQRLHRAGGLSAFALGLGYVITIPLYASVGAPPSGGEAWLRYLAGRTTIWSIIAALSVLTDLLFIPVALSLFHALRWVSRSTMLVATAFVGLFVVLDLAVTWSNYAALITLSASYAKATSDAQRAAYVAAAEYPSSVLGSGLEPVYAIAILSFAILLISLVMQRGGFSRIAACVGVITGLLGIVSVTRLGAAVILNAIFATAWVLFVGLRLYRTGATRSGKADRTTLA